MRSNEVMTLMLNELLDHRQIEPPIIHDEQYYYHWLDVRELLIDLKDKSINFHRYKKIPKKFRKDWNINIKGIIWSIKHL